LAITVIGPDCAEAPANGRKPIAMIVASGKQIHGLIKISPLKGGFFDQN
jgi:hypothetical protein